MRVIKIGNKRYYLDINVDIFGGMSIKSYDKNMDILCGYEKYVVEKCVKN